MKTSETTQKLFEAIGEVQYEIPYLGQDSKNYQNRYTSLPAFNEKTRDTLKRVGLVFSHVPDHIDGKPSLTTRLTHTPSGEWEQGTDPLPLGVLNKGNPAQDLKAATTYATRKAKHAFLSIASDDDDAISLTRPNEGKPTEDEMGPAPASLPKRYTKKDIPTADLSDLSRTDLKKRLKGANTLGLDLSERMYELEREAWTQSWKDADSEGLVVLLRSIENRVAKEG